MPITLKEALQEGKLEEFIKEQKESGGKGSKDVKVDEELAARLEKILPKASKTVRDGENGDDEPSQGEDIH